jgi:hypothetical protein
MIDVKLKHCSEHGEKATEKGKRTCPTVEATTGILHDTKKMIMGCNLEER